MLIELFTKSGRLTRHSSSASTKEPSPPDPLSHKQPNRGFSEATDELVSRVDRLVSLPEGEGEKRQSLKKSCSFLFAFVLSSPLPLGVRESLGLRDRESVRVFMRLPCAGSFYAYA